MLCWDRGVADRPEFCGAPEGFSVVKRVFNASNPTVEQLYQVYLETRETPPDTVVAIGGGSVMDVGKSLCCLYGREIDSVQELRQIMVEKDYAAPRARWIGIPTTAGTGSEATCWATIWDPEMGAKRSVELRENYAFAAIVDSELSKGMPLTLAVSSALDAVAHAVESYWARGTNLVSRALALGAIETVMGGIDGLLEGDDTAHETMARGSMMAGMAFSNTRTTACHSISYPLTMAAAIPHGTAVSMLLAPVMRLNTGTYSGEARLLAALGVSDTWELEKRIRDILRRSGQPSSLEAWGVKREDLPEIASRGMTRGRADNNPAELSAASVLKILEEIYQDKGFKKAV